MGQYEKTAFGNGVLTGSGGNVVQNVHNYFGDRDTGQTTGVFKTEGGEDQLVVNITGEMLARDAADRFLVPIKIKGGFVPTEAFVTVKKAFALGGTTPTIVVGTSGSEATNGVSISEAQAEAAGTYKLTLAGTWASAISADTTVGVALGGTTPTATLAGELELIIKYTRP